MHLPGEADSRYICQNLKNETSKVPGRCRIPGSCHTENCAVNGRGTSSWLLASATEKAKTFRPLTKHIEACWAILNFLNEKSKNSRASNFVLFSYFTTGAACCERTAMACCRSFSPVVIDSAILHCSLYSTPSYISCCLLKFFQLLTGMALRVWYGIVDF